MERFALRARWVLPISAPPIEHGVVTLQGGRILAVGKQAEENTKVEDLGEVILLPGFVNTHTHLEFSDLDNPLGQPDTALPDWIRLVITSRKQQQYPQQVVRAGVEQSISAGVTTIGEISTSPFAIQGPSPFPEVVSFQEVIGFSAARADSVFAELQLRLEAAQDAHEVGISPHAPYTVPPHLVERLVGLANAKQHPVAMHLAESREELQLLRDNSGPFRELLEERSMWDDSVFATKRTPLDYLQLLANAPRSLVVHGNYLTSEEVKFIAGQPQMSVIYCPRTHAYFGHERYPLEEMLENGVHVALGTDSRASNPDLSLLEEMRYLQQAHPTLSPERVVTLGTLQGARALGLEHVVGSLEAGKFANLITLPCESSADHPFEALLHGEQSVTRTWIRGQLAYSTSS